MAKEQFFFVIKKTFETRFAQDADVFERFKFFGTLLEASGEFHKPLPEVLRNFIKQNSKDYEVVGIIVPGRGAAVLPEHKAMSDGTSFVFVADICESYKAPMEVVDA